MTELDARTLPRRFRVTARPRPAAWGFAGIAVVATLFGMDTHNNALVLIGCIGLGIWLATFRLARRNLLGLSVERHLPKTVFAGSRFRTRLVLRRTGGKMPSALLVVRDVPESRGPARRGATFVSAVEQFEADGARTLIQEGTLFRRGRAAFRHVSVVSRHPLGLFETAVDLPCHDELVVYPALVRIPERWIPEARDAVHFGQRQPNSAGDDEFAGLREYRPGDNLRRIHWRSSARVPDRLLVREYERTPAETMTVRLDAAIEDETPAAGARFERAVQIAASLTRELVRRGHDVEFVLRRRESTRFAVRASGSTLDRLLHALALVDPVPMTELAPEEPVHAKGPVATIRPQDLAASKPLDASALWGSPPQNPRTRRV